MSLLNELKRRNVIRMAGLYLVGAWLLTQVAGTVLRDPLRGDARFEALLKSDGGEGRKP